MNIQFNVEKLKKRLKKLYAKYKYLYVVLFGSYATGHVKSYSDLDLAIMFENEIDCLSKALDVAMDLEEDMGVKVDVVPLNIADTILKYEVYGRGILLFCSNKSRFIDDKINAIDEYLDFSYHFEKFYRKTVREIANAVTGSKS
ncbi:MAG: hypothetical protein B6U95_08305 [Thermofilum sp. ex4484_82]|nr:MAG: hypothetical protein B6U95_08305 [Thermofilum sp. ex4484_82]OYT36489.1 MAG: hypothetical protein B6U96_08305 [Archaeoglobales archaeon ex4484_92]